MTEVSFTIQFPRFTAPPQRIELKPGLTVIYGESGVGKSDLCKWLAMGKQSAGNTNFHLSRITGMNDSMLVMQDPDDQIVAPSLFGELAFNLENLGWESGRIAKTISAIVDAFELDWDLDRHPSSLSGGERELLNIATSLSVSPSILIMDDSLAFLSDSNKKKVVVILEDYCEKNNATVLWTTSDPSDLAYGKQIFELMLDRLIPTENHNDSFLPDVKLVPGRLNLEITNLKFSYDGSELLFKNQNINFGPFRSLAIIGENGVGKSTLGFLIIDNIVPNSGNIQVLYTNRKKVTIGLLPQSPERYFGGWTLSEVLEKMSRSDRFDVNNMSLLINTLREFQISWDLICHLPIHDLKLSVVRVVLMVIMCVAKYDLIIIDEPMFSLGMKQRRKLLDYLSEFLTRKHMILITHSEETARVICDRAIEIRQGEIVSADIKKGTYV